MVKPTVLPKTGRFKMKRAALVTISIALVFGLWTGCSDSGTDPVDEVDPFEVRQLPAALAEDAATVVDGNNLFAFDAYGRLRETKDGNLFFSPFSISTALAMTYAGAAGETAAEMSDALRFDPDQENFHPSYGALVASLDRGEALGGYRLSVANRLWGQTGYSFLDEFLSVCDEHYGAGFEGLDFLADPDGSRETINAWVEDMTEEKIKDLLPPGSVNALTRLILTNAIYFKGDWASRFDDADTFEGDFVKEDGSVVRTPMMAQTEVFGYSRAGDFAMLELKYEGGDLSMLVLLPDSADGLGTLEENLDYGTLQSRRAMIVEEEIEVYLPKFEFTTGFSVKGILRDLGMSAAFEPPGAGEGADFTGITEARELYVTDVIHKAYVKVNEEGTEAAAATGVVVGGTSAPEHPVFRADHPFLFLIRDNVTGSILFMGRVVDPTATE
jgi:serpin B